VWRWGVQGGGIGGCEGVGVGMWMCLHDMLYIGALAWRGVHL